MRLLIDSKNTRVEILNIAEIKDNGCDLELYSDVECLQPMSILIGGYWNIGYSSMLTIEKSHLRCVDAIYLIPDELSKDEEAKSYD